MEAIFKTDLMLHAPCGLFSFDDEGRIISANPHLHEILGYERGELNGIKLEKLLNLANRIFYQTHFFPLLRLQNKVDEIFMTFITRTKTEIPVLLNAQRISEQGAFINLGALIPVHHRRKYEDELLEARKTAEKALKENEELMNAKRELELNKEALDRHISKLEQNNLEINQIKYIISHDMQEPVRKISLFSDILNNEQNFASTLKRTKVVERIKHSADKILHLITDLQTYVSISLGELNCTRIDLGVMLAELFQTHADDCRSGKMIVDLEVSQTIEGDCYQIRTLFENLISNAVRFADPFKTPVIKVHSSVIHHNSFKAIAGKFKYDEFIKLTFSDNGQGFENQYNSYVFKLMKKLDQNSPGLGFGLAVCKKVVDNHYGSISAESDPGKGTSITVLLPVKQS